MLEVKSLKKALIPTTLIPNPSPGSLQPTRLALHVNDDDSDYPNSCWAYVASGCRVYRVLVSMDRSSVSEGKQSLIIPEKTEVLESAEMNRCPHRSEIQSVVLAETGTGDGCFILGSVDSYGHLIVSKLGASGDDSDRLTFSVSPRDFGACESSWAGLSFNPSQWSMAAVARSFGKSIDVYDQDIHVRTLRSLWYPSSMVFMNNLCGGSESSVLAVAEGCQISIWDIRTKENGGCVHRMAGSVGDIIYSVCSSTNGTIAAGGADRTVTVYDPRRWCSLSRWLSCSKYEITGLAFSSVDPDYIFVQGVDYEVLCGKWQGGHKAFSYRGDSNWLGFSKCINRDILGGWCDSGNVFVADIGLQSSVTDAKESGVGSGDTSEIVSLGQ